MSTRKLIISCISIFFLLLLNFGVAGAVYIQEEKIQNLTLIDGMLRKPILREPWIYLIDRELKPEPKYNGFIVSFKEKPVVLYKKDLEKQGKIKTQIDNLVATYRNNLVSKHDLVKQKYFNFEIK